MFCVHVSISFTLVVASCCVFCFCFVLRVEISDHLLLICWSENFAVGATVCFGGTSGGTRSTRRSTSSTSSTIRSTSRSTRRSTRSTSRSISTRLLV